MYVKTSFFNPDEHELLPSRELYYSEEEGLTISSAWIDRDTLCFVLSNNEKFFWSCGDETLRNNIESGLALELLDCMPGAKVVKLESSRSRLYLEYKHIAKQTHKFVSFNNSSGSLGKRYTDK